MLGHSLQQLIRRKSPLRDRAAVYLVSLLVASTTVALLLVFAFFIDLLATRGQLQGDQEEAVAAAQTLPSGGGMRAIVVRAAGMPLAGNALEISYRRFAPLRNNQQCLLLYAACFVLLSIVLASGLYLLDRFAESAAGRVTMFNRLAIYQQSFRVGISELLSTRAPRSVALFGPQADELRRGLFSWWRTAPLSFFLIASLLLLAFLIDFWLTTAAILVTALGCLALYWSRRRAIQSQRLWHSRAHLILRRLTQQLGQTLLVAGYDLPAAPGDPAEESLRRHFRTTMRGETSPARNRPLLMLLLGLSFALLGFLLGVKVLSSPSGMALSSAVLWLSALACLVIPITRLSRLPQALVPANVAAEKILGFLERPPSVNEAADAMPIRSLAQQIRFSRVRLADRNGRRVLDDLEMEIPAGVRVALVSTDDRLPPTIAGLLLRFSDPAAGQVLMDDQDIRRSTLSSLRRMAAFVPADGMIFTASIGENLRCGEDHFTEEEIIDAAKAAGVYQRIANLPQGFDTLIGEKGTQFTADAVFGIGLARALLRRPALLIIQQPTLENPAASESLEQQILEAAQGTTIFLTSRPTLLRQLDKVYFFHKGKLLQSGTHAELIRDCELYRHVIYMRSNEYRSELV